MRVLFSPQVNDNDEIIYKLEKDIITAKYKGKEDVFDFRGMPDGVAKNIESSLDVSPIISARKEDGVLEVELLNFIKSYSSEGERFPEWQVID